MLENEPGLDLDPKNLTDADIGRLLTFVRDGIEGEPEPLSDEMITDIVRGARAQAEQEMKEDTPLLDALRPGIKALLNRGTPNRPTTFLGFIKQVLELIEEELPGEGEKIMLYRWMGLPEDFLERYAIPGKVFLPDVGVDVDFWVDPVYHLLNRLGLDEESMSGATRLLRGEVRTVAPRLPLKYDVYGHGNASSFELVPGWGRELADKVVSRFEARE